MSCIRAVIAAFRLSQRAHRVIRQNLIISMGTVVVLVTFAIPGRIPLTGHRISHSRIGGRSFTLDELKTIIPKYPTPPA